MPYVAVITATHGICQGSEPTKAAARVVPIHMEGLEAHVTVGVCRRTQLVPPGFTGFHMGDGTFYGIIRAETTNPSLADAAELAIRMTYTRVIL